LNIIFPLISRPCCNCNGPCPFYLGCQEI